MEITWFGHSCFRLKGAHATVITDPFPPELGYALGKPTARIVTVSHAHPGHSYVQGIGGDPHIANGPGEYEISGVFIIGFATYHDAEEGRSRGKNTAYFLEIDGVKIVHLGDLGHALGAESVEEIGDVDVLLVPVGGVSTINAAQAAETVRRLEPKIVVPMHYKTPALTRELGTVDGFLKEMGTQGNSQLKLSVTPNNLPLTTQVILLDYKTQVQLRF
jgi:L-ascorbate metabolism protein UlaG (beta-lactamase superfamily)